MQHRCIEMPGDALLSLQATNPSAPMMISLRNLGCHPVEAFARQEQINFPKLIDILNSNLIIDLLVQWIVENLSAIKLMVKQLTDCHESTYLDSLMQ